MQSTEIKRNQNMVVANDDVMEETLFSANMDAGFDEIEMGMADDAVELVISMLTDLSADRGAYALRETFSNAYDATVVAGDMSLPIEIELPPSNPFSNNIATALGYNTAGATVTVRDHGCGMTEDDVRSYFTQYGGSKKRTTADVDTIGSKGLGSKAPLAVADTFRVRTVKDGIETTAILERKRGKNWASIKSEPTDAPNGTEVVFPIQDSLVYEQVASCVKDIARYAIDANVLVNGEKIAPAIVSGENTEDYIYIGEVAIGTDENGKPATFKLWESVEDFPVVISENANVAFSLAGVNYTLQQRNRYAAFGFPACDNKPSFILEGAPGYLNFTPSRDEIKKDSVREVFVSELLSQARGLDYSDAVVRVLTALDAGYERMHWLFETYDFFSYAGSETIGASTSPFRSFGPVVTTAHVPLSVLESNDGRATYRAVLPSDDSAKVYFTLSGKSFMYGSNGSMECNHNRMVINKLAKGKWQEEIFGDEERRVTVCDVAYDILRHSYKSRSGWDRDSLKGKDASEACVVIYGIDDADNVKKLLNCEKSLRAKLNAEMVAYIFADEKLGEGDLDALAGAFKTVVEMECADAIEDAKEYAAKIRKAAPARAKHDEVIDWNKIDNRVYKLSDEPITSPLSIRSVDVSFSWKNDANSVAIIPFNITRTTSNRTFAPALSVCDLMRKVGVLNVSHVAFCDVKNTQIKQLATEGYIFVADLRKNVKTHPVCVIDDIEWVSVGGYDERSLVVNEGAVVAAAKVSDRLAEFVAASCAAGRFYSETFCARDAASDVPLRSERILLSFLESYGKAVAEHIESGIKMGECDKALADALPILRLAYCDYSERHFVSCLSCATIGDNPTDTLSRGAYDVYALVKGIYDMMSSLEFTTLCRSASEGFATLFVPGIMDVVRKMFPASDE